MEGWEWVGWAVGGQVGGGAEGDSNERQRKGHFGVREKPDARKTLRNPQG